MPLDERKKLLCTIKTDLSMRSKTTLLDINRSTLFYKPKTMPIDKQKVREHITTLYLEQPTLGYRRITALLASQYGITMNRKAVYLAMVELEIKGITPKRNLSLNRTKEHRYPYLLKTHPPAKPGDAWAIDITYIKHKGGYFYITCIIDIVSRMVVGYAINNTLDTKGSLDALKSALKRYPKPQILNSDQGVQFTSHEWVNFLAEKGIKISMDGKGRWADNIFIERFWRSLKYEEVYLRSYESLEQARKYIIQFIEWYNNTRPHQSLKYKAPKNVYFKAVDEATQLAETNNTQAANI